MSAENNPLMTFAQMFADSKRQCDPPVTHKYLTDTTTYRPVSGIGWVTCPRCGYTRKPEDTKTCSKLHVRICKLCPPEDEANPDCFNTNFQPWWYPDGEASWQPQQPALSGGSIMQMLQQLRSFNTDGLQTEEAVALLAFGRQMELTYTSTVEEAPEWLRDANERLGKEVRSRFQDEMEKRLKEIQQRREALKTADEKRKDLAAEEERLLAKLGRGTKDAA